MFLFFMSRECEECFNAQKDWIELSTIVNKQTIVARTDCHFDREVCDTFRPRGFPFLLYFIDNKIFRY